MPTLTPEHWQQLSPYLDQVLELPEEQRQAWLKEFATTKPELAGLLSELLKEHATLDRKHFLEGTSFAHGIMSSLAGQKIGPYTLMSPIGE
ncbi:MAG TPA: hypothetical protein VJQ54_17115, partial [Candidatus Sulfotelmatobacter sp.]|nr:hypothetical protein [Candidatus Sulfotelmatobacter sp.]